MSRTLRSASAVWGHLDPRPSDSSLKGREEEQRRQGEGTVFDRWRRSRYWEGRSRRALRPMQTRQVEDLGVSLVFPHSYIVQYSKPTGE